MNLILDWGNTNLKCAVFEQDDLMENLVINENYEEEITTLISKYVIKKGILSSVINTPAFVYDILNEINGFEFENSTLIPIINKYKTPDTLGKDRLANAVALSKLYPKQNVLSIDFGTCLKFDFVNEQNEYLGGAISPGFEMRLDAMHQFTDRLPLVDIVDINDFIGNNTNESILSGAYFGLLAEVLQIINFYKSRFHNLKVIATGGDLQYFEKELKNTIFANPFLTLVGLNEILKHNDH